MTEQKKSPVPKLSKFIIRELAKSEDFKINGEHQKALEIAQKVLESDPSCVQAAEEVADNLLTLGREKEAKKAATFAYKLENKSYIANYILGFLELSNGEKAIKHLEQANKSFGNNPEILRCLGWALFHSNKHFEGIATLERALNLRPNDALILCDLGVCLLHQNIFLKAVKLFEKALSLDPKNERAKECLYAANKLKNEIETEIKNLPKNIQNIPQE